MEIPYPTDEELEEMFRNAECEPRDDEILVIEAPSIFDEMEGLK